MTTLRNPAIFLAVLIPIVVLGFWPRYFSVIGDAPTTFHVHGFLMSAWVLMLISQAWLITTSRTTWHRRMGKLGFVLGPLVAWSALLIVHESLNAGPATLVPGQIIGSTLSVGGLFSFLVTLTLAVVYRKQPALHGRFMVSTALAIIGAGLARVYVNWVFDDRVNALHAMFLTLELVALTLVAVDMRAGRKRSPFLVILGLLGLQHLYWYTAFDLPIARALAELIQGLPPLAPWSP